MPATVVLLRPVVMTTTGLLTPTPPVPGTWITRTTGWVLETGKAGEAWELGLGVTIVTVEQVPMVAGVTDLNFTVPGRGLNLAAAGFTLCLAAN